MLLLLSSQELAKNGELDKVNDDIDGQKKLKEVQILLKYSQHFDRICRTEEMLRV